jgi:hypothetical protein
VEMMNIGEVEDICALLRDVGFEIRPDRTIQLDLKYRINIVTEDLANWQNPFLAIRSLLEHAYDLIEDELKKKVQKCIEAEAKTL